MVNPRKRRPVVFISYSHDSDAHKVRVVKMAERLAGELSVDVRLDQHSENAVANWPRWMRRQLTSADYILMVFTKNYRQRFDGRVSRKGGRGVAWEGMIITNLIYSSIDSEARSRKFVPISFHRSGLRHVPSDLFSGNRFVIGADWEKLCRFIEQPLITESGPKMFTSEQHPKPTKGVVLPGHVQKPDEMEVGLQKLQVLFLGAEKHTGLDLKGQLSETRDAIRRGLFGSKCSLTGLFDLSLDRMIMEVGNRKPDVLHLSGKQQGGKIKLHDKNRNLVPVSANRLADLLTSLNSPPRLVVLDTCDSLAQARFLSKKSTSRSVLSERFPNRLLLVSLPCFTTRSPMVTPSQRLTIWHLNWNWQNWKVINATVA